MPVDKIIPRQLNSDEDERLVEQGQMTDAENVTISENGKGTQSIVKNCKGTIPGYPVSEDDAIANNDHLVVIGSVSDSQRGFVYFFAADREVSEPPTSARHAIYQYNANTHQYREVMRDSRLNFDPNGFVKADVVNGQFQQDGVTQSILYFTDNINPPRKINVDRALAGQYDFPDAGVGNDYFDYSVNSIKAPSTRPPLVSFEDDDSVPHNNIGNNVFQFATQIIYRDGEESAISPYSKLLIPTKLTFKGLESTSSPDSTGGPVGIGQYIENVAVIDHNIPNVLIDTPDVEAIRLLARYGNEDAFFVIDEFQANQNKSRAIFGSQKVVYNAGSGKYRFYNDILGRIVPNTTVDKMYDNVPFEARGQAVSGNRLMYSNYTEGRPNVNVSANLSVSYTGSSEVFGNLIDQTDSNDDGLSDAAQNYITGVPSSPGIRVDFAQLFGIAAADFSTTFIEAGTQVNVSLGWSANLSGSITSIGDQPIFTIEDENIGTSAGVGAGVEKCEVYTMSFVEPEVSGTDTGSLQFEFDTFENNFASLDFSFVVPQTLPFLAVGEDNFVDLFVSTMSTQTIEVFYNTVMEAILYNNVTSEAWNDSPLTLRTYSGLVTSPELSSSPNVMAKVSLDLSNIGFSSPTTVNFSTSVSKVSLEDGVYGVPIEDLPFPIKFAGPPSTNPNYPWMSYMEVSGLESLTVLNGYDSDLGFSPSYVVNQRASAFNLSAQKGFKSGALHPLGVVYYDKFNRSGYVNDIGNVYAAWLNSEDRITDEGDVLDGPAQIQVDFLSEPPEWADTYQIVYPGNSTMTDFVQYTVGNAYPARVPAPTVDDSGNTVTGLPVRSIDFNSKRLYVNFETLERYKLEKQSFRDYTFKEGDRLRIASFRGDTLGGTVVPEELGVKFPSANDGVSIMEFEVVGVEILGRDQSNPIAFRRSGGADQPIENLGQIRDEHVGTFLVLENQAISEGASNLSGQQLKYSGFDWFSVTRYHDPNGDSLIPGTTTPAYTYPDGSTPTGFVNHWLKQTVVEIYSPKLATEADVYYEIGEARPIVNVPPSGLFTGHGPAFTISSGDIHFRPVSCKGPRYDDFDSDGDNEFNSEDPPNWGYDIKNLESQTAFEFTTSRDWDKGRPHIKNENAATIRRFNGITYSDEYSEDIENLTLSSFNQTLLNFYSLDSQYGACNYIGNYGDVGALVGIQENKFSITPVNRSILTDASGQNNLALTSEVLKSTNYYSGDYGCANHPESVLIQDNDVYFFDRSRHKALRFVNSQLVPISDQGVSSLIADQIDAMDSILGVGEGRIVSGYDPDDDLYYLTFTSADTVFNFSEDPLFTPIEEEEDTGGGDDTGGGGGDEPPPLPPTIPIYVDFDFNDDGQVDTNDLLALLAFFGTIVEAASVPAYVDPDGDGVFVQENNNQGMDIDGNGVVGALELLGLLAAFGNPNQQIAEITGVNAEGNVVTYKVPTSVSALDQYSGYVFNTTTNQVEAVASPGLIGDERAVLSGQAIRNILENVDLLSGDLRTQVLDAISGTFYQGFTIG